MVYYLPAKQFNISAEFELQDCLVDGDQPVVLYTPSAVVTESLVPDVSQVHYIRYEKLSAKTKVVGFNIQLYDNGTLKSVNAKAEDRSGQIITSVVEAAGTVARGLALGRFYSADQKRPEDVCSQQFLKLLSVKANAQNRLAEDKQTDKARKAKAAQVSEALGTFVEAKVKVADLAKTSTDREKAEAVRALAIAELTLAALKAELADLGESRGDIIAAELAAARAALTEKVNIVWQPSVGNMSTTVAYPDASFNKLFKGTPPFKAIQVQVVLQHPLGAATLVGAPVDAKNESRGIVYRQPVSARLSICPGSCVDGQKVQNAILSQAYLVPQLGALGALPLRNEIFDKNSLVLAQTTDGTLVSLQFDSEASLERAAEAAKAASAKYIEAVSSLIKDRRTELDAQRDDRSKERTETRGEAAALRKEEADSLKAAAERIELLREVEIKRTGELDKVQLEIDRTDKERRLIEAQVELARKRKELARELAP